MDAYNHRGNDHSSNSYLWAHDNVLTDPFIAKVQKSIDLMRLFDNQVPAQVLSVFFYIAAHDGCALSRMPKELGLAQSSISRCTDWLSDYHRLGKPGMGLIVKRKDPLDSRLRRAYLTPKGKNVVRTIKELLSHD